MGKWVKEPVLPCEVTVQLFYPFTHYPLTLVPSLSPRVP